MSSGQSHPDRLSPTVDDRTILAPLVLLRPCSREHISIYTLHGEPLFFQHFDGPFFPTLRLLHKCTYLPLLDYPHPSR